MAGYLSRVTEGRDCNSNNVYMIICVSIPKLKCTKYKAQVEILFDTSQFSLKAYLWKAMV